MLYGIITNSIRASRRTQRTFFSFRSHSKCLLSYFKLFWRCDAANNWTLMRSGDNGSVYTMDRWKRHTIIIFAEWPMIAHRSALIMINAILFLDHRWPSPVCTHDDDNNGNNHVSMPFAYIESKTQVKCAVKMRLPEISHTHTKTKMKHTGKFVVTNELTTIHFRSSQLRNGSTAHRMYYI